IVTENKEMFSIFDYVESIAQTNQPVLITGETGVGKELIAKCIYDLSTVKGELVVVNVAGLDDSLFSDTLFGHTRGAFSGADKMRGGIIERAKCGTLFLDEIGDLSLSSQVKLLRLLENGEYFPLGQDVPKITDARILTATNMDLWSIQRTGQFRKDLNFRLRTHHVHLPPLRERKDDIPLLVNHFLRETATENDEKKQIQSEELYSILKAYSFPGNIRELQAMIIDAVSRTAHDSEFLSVDAIKNHIERSRQEKMRESGIRTGIDEAFPLAHFSELPTIRQMTDLLIIEALKRTDNNQSRAAKLLGISQPALSKRLKKR
ncbi:sigma 54-interacting transcriptional regulator, partial [Desulfobacterales bacterium HSG16]|nr:sigma 54-interacting transcriptional regulator [Desulfobacterales bacterium HSG16]